MVRGGGFAGGPVVVNNTLQWKLFRERVYNIFSYTQLFRVKNFSSICLYCIISSKPCGGEGVGGGQICLFSSSLHFGVWGGGDASEQNNVRTLCSKKS